MIDTYFNIENNICVQHNNYLLCAFPYKQPNGDLNVKPKDELFFRYAYDFEQSSETEWWYIVKDTPENLEDYNSNQRRKIRKGLKSFTVRKATNEEIKEDGYNVYKKCMQKYEVSYCSKQDFSDYIKLEQNGKIPIEYMGIYFEDKLVGYSKNFINHHLKMVFYETINVDGDYNKQYINYALIHMMNSIYLNDEKYKYVCDGSRTLLHPTGIQQFLIDKFKFRKAYCKMGVVYNPKVNLIVKCFYPFRKQIAKISTSKFKKLSALLEQERIRRSFN